MTAASARKQKSAVTSNLAGPAVVVRPTSAKEIVQILLNPKRFPSPVRPMGSGSSITRCITANGGTIVDMTAMNRVLRIEEDTVTIQPGIALSDLADVLAERGMELIGGFDLANRTVGGAVCGAGLEATIAGDVSQFGGHATQLKVISPVGKKFVVTDKTKSLLSLMRLSYGLLGIVYEVTVRIRPIQSFTSKTAKVSFKDFTKLGPRLTAAGSGVKLFLFPFNDRIFFELRQPNNDLPGRKDYVWKIRDWALYSALPVVAKSLARALPFKPIRYPLLDNIGQATQSWMANGRERKSSNAAEQSGRYRTLGPQRFTYCTWAFPAGNIAKVAASYKLFCKTFYQRTGFRCDMPTIAYRLNQDRTALLSPSFDGQLFTISPLSTDDSGWDDRGGPGKSDSAISGFQA
jgi:L-gulonolactone oxidase